MMPPPLHRNDIYVAILSDDSILKSILTYRLDPVPMDDASRYSLDPRIDHIEQRMERIYMLSIGFWYYSIIVLYYYSLEPALSNIFIFYNLYGTRCLSPFRCFIRTEC